MCNAYAVKEALMGFVAGTVSLHECGSTKQQSNALLCVMPSLPYSTIPAQRGPYCACQ